MKAVVQSTDRSVRDACLACEMPAATSDHAYLAGFADGAILAAACEDRLAVLTVVIDAFALCPRHEGMWTAAMTRKRSAR